MAYVFNQKMLGFSSAGFPIRISSDCRLYTATRGFSQCPTSFFGTRRLGIHRKLLVAQLLVMRRNRNFSLLFFSFTSNYSMRNIKATSFSLLMVLFLR